MVHQFTSVMSSVAGTSFKRFLVDNVLIVAQRKIPVVLSFPYHRHKAGGASPLA